VYLIQDELTRLALSFISAAIAAWLSRAMRAVLMWDLDLVSGIVPHASPIPLIIYIGGIGPLLPH